MYYRFEKNVPNDSLKVTKAGQEEVEEIDSSLSAINDAAKAVKDLMLENIEEQSGDIAFGADNTDVLLVKGESFASKLNEIISLAEDSAANINGYLDSLEISNLDVNSINSRLDFLPAAFCSYPLPKALAAVGENREKHHRLVGKHSKHHRTGAGHCLRHYAKSSLVFVSVAYIMNRSFLTGSLLRTGVFLRRSNMDSPSLTGKGSYAFA